MKIKAIDAASGNMRMDTEIISKNEASLKSLTSKVTFLVTLLVLLLICSTNLIAQQRTFKSYAFRIVMPENLKTIVEKSDRENSMTISMENNAAGKRVFHIKMGDTNGPLSNTYVTFTRQIGSGLYRYSGTCGLRGNSIPCLVDTTKPLSDFVTNGVQDESVLKMKNSFLIYVNGTKEQFLLQIFPLNQNYLPLRVENFDFDLFYP